MSSTDRDDEKRAAALFDEEVVPLRKPAAVASSPASFYADVPPLAKRDFELRVGSSAQEVRAILLTEWQSYPELHPLAEALAKFADTLPPTADETTELSPFIYVMF